MRPRCTATSRASGWARSPSSARWCRAIGRCGATTSTHGSASPTAATMRRFDGIERAVHWVNAALFLTLLATGSALYVGPISTLVGRRELVKTMHVYAGLALPLPVLLGFVLPRRRTGFRDDARRLNRFGGDDWRWLKSLGRRPGLRLGKFNPGQKLNAAFVAGAIPVMLATGSIMR